MLSLREIQRGNTKAKILSTGGGGNYHIDANDFDKLANLFSTASTQQMKPLIKSLLTKREIVDITRRMLIAKASLEGSTYEEINQKTKAGKQTISFVKQSILMNDGILKKLIEQTDNLTPVDQYIKRRLKKGK